MKQISSADFRRTYSRESGPIEVTAYGKVIGTWYPAGVELPSLPTPPIQDAQPEEAPRRFEDPAPRMTIRPVKGEKKELVGTPTRVLDPLDMQRRERERYSELSARLYGSGKKK
jgi:hypothetical protein